MKSHEEAEEYPMIKLITSKFSSFLLLVVTFIIQFKRTNKQRQCENDILESRPLSRGRKNDENSTSQHTLMSQIRHFLLSNYYGNIRRSSRLLFHSFFVVLSNPIKMLEEHWDMKDFQETLTKSSLIKSFDSTLITDISHYSNIWTARPGVYFNLKNYFSRKDLCGTIKTNDNHF